MMIKRDFLVCLLLSLSILGFGQIPCENGFAGPYPCHNVDLLRHIDSSQLGGATTNEVWGWTDPLTGIEYVLLGLSTGVRFYDIQDPLQPVWIGTLPRHTSNSMWRTLREANNYLFVGSEASGHGMQVFDLTRLRNVVNPPVTFSHDAHYAGFSRCHTLAICQETGLLFACGTNTYSGGLHIVNIQNPLNPVLAGGYDVDGYTHESQVVVYDGPDPDFQGHTVVFCYNGNNPASLTIVDATDPSETSTISITNYPNGYYCHQGWLTEDKHYLLMDDELDEVNGPFDQTRTLIWNVSDLDNPIYMGDFLGPTAAIDHNQIIKGNIAYQSNYAAGLRLMDVTDIASLQLHEVGYFDHYPASDASVFQGEWMSYPYFESGVVPVTNIYDGLFLLKPNFIQINPAQQTVCNTQNTFGFQVNLKEGFKGPFQFELLGLPPTANFSFQSGCVNGPCSVQFTISGVLGTAETMDLELLVTGSSHHYSAPIQIQFIEASTWYLDLDGDGFGTQDFQISACVAPQHYTLVAGDCNDQNALIFPNAPSSYSGIDNNCNGIIDPQEIAICPDLNADQLISVADLIIFIGSMDCVDWPCAADFNQDQNIGIQDLMILLANFATYCP